MSPGLPEGSIHAARNFSEQIRGNTVDGRVRQKRRARIARAGADYRDGDVERALRAGGFARALIEAEEKPARDGDGGLLGLVDGKSLGAIARANACDERAVAGICDGILMDQVAPSTREAFGAEGLHLRLSLRIGGGVRGRAGRGELNLGAREQVDFRIEPHRRAPERPLRMFFRLRLWCLWRMPRRRSPLGWRPEQQCSRQSPSVRAQTVKRR